MKEQLDSLVGMMVDRGILLEEAMTEFEKKFIRRVWNTPVAINVARPESWEFTAIR